MNQPSPPNSGRTLALLLIGVVLGAAAAGLLWSGFDHRGDLARADRAEPRAVTSDPLASPAQGTVPGPDGALARRVVDAAPDAGSSSESEATALPDAATPAAAARLIGRVVDARGDAVPHAKVAIADRGDRAPAFIAGLPREMLDGLPAGAWLVELDGAIAVPARPQTVVVTAGETVRVVL